jgi:hypothetical protein
MRPEGRISEGRWSQGSERATEGAKRADGDTVGGLADNGTANFMEGGLVLLCARTALSILDTSREKGEGVWVAERAAVEPTSPSAK